MWYESRWSVSSKDSSTTMFLWGLYEGRVVYEEVLRSNLKNAKTWERVYGKTPQQSAREWRQLDGTDVLVNTVDRVSARIGSHVTGGKRGNWSYHAIVSKVSRAIDEGKRDNGAKGVTESSYMWMKRYDLQADVQQLLCGYVCDMRKANGHRDEETELAELVAFRYTIAVMRNTASTPNIPVTSDISLTPKVTIMPSVLVATNVRSQTVPANTKHQPQPLRASTKSEQNRQIPIYARRKRPALREDSLPMMTVIRLCLSQPERFQRGQGERLRPRQRIASRH